MSPFASGLVGVERPLLVRRAGIAGTLKFDSLSESGPLDVCLETGVGRRTVNETFGVDIVVVQNERSHGTCRSLLEQYYVTNPIYVTINPREPPRSTLPVSSPPTSVPQTSSNSPKHLDMNGHVEQQQGTSTQESEFDIWDFMTCAKCNLPFASDGVNQPSVPFWLTNCGHVICNSHLSVSSSHICKFTD